MQRGGIYVYFIDRFVFFPLLPTLSDVRCALRHQRAVETLYLCVYRFRG